MNNNDNYHNINYFYFMPPRTRIIPSVDFLSPN